MMHSPNLFPLKLLVISLGLALVGAMVTVFTSIYVKADRAFAPANCADATVNLHHAGTVTNVTSSGKTVQITLASPPKTLLLTIDRCRGAVLQTLTIEP